jgi:hypothetical protein
MPMHRWPAARCGLDFISVKQKGMTTSQLFIGNQKILKSFGLSALITLAFPNYLLITSL